MPVDPRDFRELVGNLLENACKWARNRIHFSAVRQNGHFSLLIQDDGPGGSQSDCQIFSAGAFVSIV
ncbi:ATP-binding protein [Rhizobium laguerreae]|uniref:ATP-binding protein n=1 Tax=Rhizobium laguerreae TaxID=1076926 RepID=UPI0035E42438